jgi:hypothetical protein
MEPDHLRKIEIAVKENEEALGRLKNILKEMKSGQSGSSQHHLASLPQGEDSPAWARIFGS